MPRAGPWGNDKSSESISLPPLLILSDLGTHSALFGNLQCVLHFSFSPTPSKEQWAPVPTGFDVELCISDSAVKGFLAWLRSETKTMALWTRQTQQSSVWFGFHNTYKNLNLMRCHMKVRCISFSWEVGLSHNMAMAAFPFDSTWLVPSRGSYSLHYTPGLPLLMDLCTQLVPLDLDL